MRTKVQKWGNSLGLRIPRAIAEDAGIVPGSEVELALRRGELVLKPLRPRSYLLKDLLRRMTRKNAHAEVETGRPVGKEAW